MFEMDQFFLFQNFLFYGGEVSGGNTTKCDLQQEELQAEAEERL